MYKTVFIANRWIKFLYNGETCIGTTYLYDENDKDEEPLYQLVFLISQKRKCETINFSECKEIKYLKFVEQPIEANKVNGLTNIIDQTIDSNSTKKCISELAKKQTNKILRN